jgi:hypothetical protein
VRFSSEHRQQPPVQGDITSNKGTEFTFDPVDAGSCRSGYGFGVEIVDIRHAAAPHIKDPGEIVFDCAKLLGGKVTV